MPRFLIVIFSMLAFVAGCSAEQPQKLPVHPDPLRIVDINGTEKAVFDIEIARTGQQRGTGLMHRRDLPPDRAMLFIFPNEEERFFWMKNTPTSLDIIYVDSIGTVVSIAKDAVPFSTDAIPSGQPARYVLEVLAGSTDDKGIVPGDQLLHLEINN